MPAAKRSRKPRRSSRSADARHRRGTGQASRSSRARTRRPAARTAARRPRAIDRGDSLRLAERDTVRYAVVGLGYFAQAAVLPAFRKAQWSELVALVSDDATKLRELGDKYGVERLVRYSEYEELLASGEVDAVYICLPNDLHEEFTVRAAEHGVHVLCEKPLAVTSAECRRMIDACRRNRVKLMTAYRLHFNHANLEAVKAIQEGEVGDPRYIVSAFSMQVKPTGIRTREPDRGGGPLYDIGVYCINAARYLFRDEPVWVQAATATGQDQKRFRRIDEQVTCILGFPKGRTATFTASYGAYDCSVYEVYGTSGMLCLENAYDFTTGMKLQVEGEQGNRTRRYLKRDQVAPELTHFSSCLLDGKDPEPSGKEGLIDVAIIEAVQRAASTGRRVPLRTPTRRRRPTHGQADRVRPHRMPDLVNAQVPFQD
jgi:predicted dehydrogenase